MMRAKSILFHYFAVSAGSIATGLCLCLAFPAVPAWLAASLAAPGASLLLLLIAWSRHRRSLVASRTAMDDTHFKDAILRFVTESASLHERAALYDLLLETAVAAIPEAAMGSLIKVDGDGTVHFEAAYGHDMNVLRTLRLREAETFIHVKTDGRCDRTVIVNDYQQINRRVLDEERYNLLEEGTADLSMSSILSAPVRIDGELWGMLNIDSKPGCRFHETHIGMLDVFVNETVKVIRMFREQERILWLMRHDALTGTINRLHFTERFKKDLEAAARGECFGTLVSIDLDGFKTINDRYGHATGDLALTHFSHVFSCHLSPDDYLSRYGGDEFMAVLMGKRAPQALETMDDLTGKLLAAPLPIAGDPAVLRFSYGLAEFDSAHHDHKELLHGSDARMYACKKEKRQSK